MQNLNTSQETIVTKSLDLHLNVNRANKCLIWGAFNALVFCLILFDLSYKCPYSFSKWYYIEYAILTITSVSVVSYMIQFIYLRFTLQPIYGTDAQRTLLTFDEADKSFLTNQPKVPPKDETAPPLNSTILSWHSSFNESVRGFSSPNWVSTRTTPPRNMSPGLNVSMNSSYNNTSFNVSSPSNPTFYSGYKAYKTKSDTISSEKELRQFLNEESKQEYSSEVLRAQSAINSASINSFWNYYNTATNLFKTTLYQLSPSEVSPVKQSKKEESGTDPDSHSEILKKISPEKLSQYVANLRMWISSTILKRLENEINNLDTAFKTRGFSDIQIGSVGLERLKKTAENDQFVSMYVPMLPSIVPFLEMTTNQEYFVQRIKDLAKGSCIADYKHIPSGDDHLPTDAAILFHLFCTYLDSQLMPLPQPGGRPFFNRYVVIGDKTAKEIELKNKSRCAIICTNQIKPKFSFFSEDKIHHCAYDRNNLFYVIIQFLIYMKKHNEGLLEGVNLGKSGINILCVTED